MIEEDAEPQPPAPAGVGKGGGKGGGSKGGGKGGLRP